MAKTKWWYCGQCGFKNHPRHGQEATLCEQCGASRNDPDAKDYNPGGEVN